MNKPIKVIMFGNGNTAAFDKNGKQIPELQKAWLQLYCELLDKHNIDPTEIDFDLPMGHAKVFNCKGEDTGETWYNWQM